MSLVFFFSLSRQELMVISSSLNSIGHIKTEQRKKAQTENLDGRRGGKVSKNSMKATAVSSRLRSDSIRSFKRNSCHHKLPFHARFLRLPLSAPSQRLPTAPINLQATPCSPPAPSCLQPPPFPSKRQLHPGRWWKKCGQISDLQHSGNGFIAIV